MEEAKRLIEVAMPVKEVSVESVQDKYIHHGHISTLHIWWARRPLPVSRAAVFASLVPDPLDSNAPKNFIEACEKLLKIKVNGKDVYKPYKDIPYTSIIDPLDDNLRNRLLAFVGKFSEKYIENSKQLKATKAKETLSDYSLVKWDSKNNESILETARKLIWCSYSNDNDLKNYDEYRSKIDYAEKALYETVDRHKNSDDIKTKTTNLHNSIREFQERMPKVFDPFAGGGAIPLEASRLGCRSYGNDINPVANLIQIASLKYPQLYGKPIKLSSAEYERLYSDESSSDLSLFNSKQSEIVEIDNRLLHDVEYWGKKLLNDCKKEYGKYYAKEITNEKDIPVVFYWGHFVTCENPSCKATVPMLKQFYLCKKKNQEVYLNPIIDDNNISFEIKRGKNDLEGWNYRGNLTCPCCSQTTDIKQIKKQYNGGKVKERLLAVVYDKGNGKEYGLPTDEELEITREAMSIDTSSISPSESMQRNSAGGDTFSWGIDKWGQLFNNRQILIADGLIKTLNSHKTILRENYDKSYADAISTYQAILVDRILAYATRFGRWIPQNQQLTSLFGRQAISMVFDYPEVNVFAKSTSAGLNQLDWITRYLESESFNPFHTECLNASSGDVNQFEKKSITATVTDPPYYDAIAYADISDFFYVWLKRSMQDIYPTNFAFPQTPKTDECTALKHHHEGDYIRAKNHFNNKLKNILKVVEHQTNGIVSIMFAHQSTEAWTTLCDSILGANMNITSSWAIDTERDTRMVANSGAALASSVTVSCRPVDRTQYGDYSDVKANIKRRIRSEVEYLYSIGFRGADLLTSCFGLSVSEFGKYKSVEKADGSTVSVSELLEMAREAAFDSIISDIHSDDFTKFYIGWLNLFGFTETQHDNVRRITQIGLSIDSNELLSNKILNRNGDMEAIANYKERNDSISKLGEKSSDFEIDKAHKMMYLYQVGDRQKLLGYISKLNIGNESNVWRILNSLIELLPSDSLDHKQCLGLLTNKESLLRDAKNVRTSSGEQVNLEFE